MLFKNSLKIGITKRPILYYYIYCQNFVAYQHTNLLINPQNQCPLSVCHRLAVSHQLFKSLSWWNSSFHNQYDTRPLSLPFVPSLCYLLVSVTHHGNQHVHQQNSHYYHVDYE